MALTWPTSSFLSKACPLACLPAIGTDCVDALFGKPCFPPGLSFPAGAVGTSPGTCLAHDRAKLRPRGCVWEVQFGEQLSHEAAGPDTIDSAVSLWDVKNQNIATVLMFVGGTKAPVLAQARSHGERVWRTCLECGGAHVHPAPCKGPCVWDGEAQGGLPSPWGVRSRWNL